MSSVDVGGCLPWPPLRWPPVEPDPTEHELDQPVDWMTYPHWQLRMMATNYVDLPGATSVAAEWAKLGDALDEVGEGLREVVEVSSTGWRGAAAEQARETGRKLSEWSADAGVGALEAGGCVSRQAANAEWARNEMPELLPGSVVPTIFIDFRGRRPETGTEGLPTPADFGGSPFTSGGFDDARLLIVDPGPEREERQQRHRRAAEVMRQMQRNSAEVHGSVPRFVPPGEQVETFRIPGDDSDDELRTQPQEHGTDDDGGTVAASSGPGALGAVGGGVSGREMAGPGAPLGAGGVAGVGSEHASRSGGAAAGQGAAASAASAGAAGQRGAPGVAGMPMGAAGGGSQRGDGTERKTPAYLAGDSDLFAPEDKVVPPVIGADPHGQEGR